MIFNLAELQCGDTITLTGDEGFTLEAVVITPGDEPAVTQRRNECSIPEKALWLGITDLAIHRFHGPRFIGQGEEVLHYALTTDDDEQDRSAVTPQITMLEIVRGDQTIVKWSW